ncbi:histidine kinase dimerization/phospho-acceptor domain-containing protein [Marinibaculum pumilum]|uniref:histidine kinase n=1 Tax=Marinibaculum pumilum TaxID=1766165 RepID=A0ABV7LB64_9PROT
MNDATHAFTPGMRVRRWLAGPRRSPGRKQGGKQGRGRGLGPDLKRGLGWAVLSGTALGLLSGGLALLAGFPAGPLEVMAWTAMQGLAVALAVWLLLVLRTRSRLARAEARLHRLAPDGAIPFRTDSLDQVERLEAGTLLSLRRLHGRAVRAASQLDMVDALVEAAPDGIIVVRPDQTIARINRTCARLFDYQPADLIGRPLHLLVPEEHRAAHRDHVERFAAGPDMQAAMAQDRVVMGRRRDGSEFPIAASIGRAELRGETVLIAIVRDLSALERAKLEAEAAAVRAQAAARQAALADRSKTEFLANMSHELRTPLNGIIGFAEMMKLETFGPLGHQKYREYVDDIGSAGAHLLAILSDILDVSRLDLDTEPAQRRPTDLSPVVQNVVRSFRERLPGGVTFDMSGFDTSLPVLANERALRQVLLNIVANASRFVPAEGGLIAIEAIAGREGSAGDEGGPAEAGDRATALRGFRVRDNGEGFSQTVLQRFGTPFNTDRDSQLSGDGSMSGTGLGLYICKRIMEGLQGRIELANDDGAVVTVLFDAAPPS